MPTGAYVLLMPLKTCCAKSETPSPILCALLISVRTISFSLYLNLLSHHMHAMSNHAPFVLPACHHFVCTPAVSPTTERGEDLTTTLGLPRRAKTRM